MSDKIKDHIFPDQAAYGKVAWMIKHVEGFKCQIIGHEKTYPNPDDTKITMRVQGRDKDHHAIDMIAWLTYKVGSWKEI